MTKQKKIVFGTALVIAGLGLITLIDIQTMRLKSNLKEGYMDELGIVVKRMEDMVNNMFRKNNSDNKNSGNENRNGGNENNGLKRRDNDKSRDQSRNNDTSRDARRDARNIDQSRKTDDNSEEGSVSPRVVVLDGDDKDLKNGSGVNKITMLTETDKDKTKGVAVVSANVTDEDKENMNSASKNKKSDSDKKDDKRPNVTIITTDDKKKDGMSMMIIASDNEKNDDKKKDEVVSTPFSDDKKKEEEKLASDDDRNKDEDKATLTSLDGDKKRDEEKLSSLSLDDDKKKDDEKVTLPSNDSNRSSPMTLGDKNKDVLGSPFSGDKNKKNPLSASDDKKKEEESRSAPLFDDKRNSMSLTSTTDKKKEEEKIITKPSSDDKDKEESKSDDKKNPMSMTIIATDDKKKDDDKDKKNPLSMMIIATDNKGTNNSGDKKKDDKDGAMNLTIITAEGSTSPEADKRKRNATLDDDKKKKDDDLLPLASDMPAFGSLEMLNYDMNSILSGDKDKKEKEIKITPGTSDSNKDDDKKKNELTNDKSKSTSDGDYKDEGRGKKLRESKQSSSDENKKMASKALFGKSDDHENKDEKNKNDSGYNQNTNIYIMPQKDKEEKKPILIVPIKESKAAATPYQVNSTLSTPQNKPKHRSKLVVMQRTITQTVRPLSKDKEEKKKKTEIKNDKKQWKKNGEKESKMPKLFNSLQSQPTVRLSARRESENGSYDRKARDESDLDSSVEMENSSISSIDNEDYSKKERSMFGNKSKNSQNKNKQRSIDNENKKRSSNDKDQSGMFVKNLTFDDGKDEDHLNDKYLSNYGFGNNPADFFDKTFQSDYKNDSSKKAPLTVGDTKRKSSDNEGMGSPSSGDDKNKNTFSGRSIDLLSDDYKNSNQRSTKPSVNLDDNDEKDKDAFRRKSLDMFTDGGSNETGVRSFTPFSDFSKVTTPINSSFSTLSNDDDDKKKSPFDSSASLYNFNDKVNDQAYGGQSIDDLLQNFDTTFGQPDEDKMGTNELFNILEEGKTKSEDDKPHGKQPVLKSSLTKSLEDSDEMKFPHHNPTNLERTYIDPFNLQTEKLIEQNLNPGEMDVRGANLNVTDDKQNLN